MSEWVVYLSDTSDIYTVNGGTTTEEEQLLTSGGDLQRCPLPQAAVGSSDHEGPPTEVHLQVRGHEALRRRFIATSVGLHIMYTYILM